jgi:mono/diheme cytochrome c family protein
VRGCCAIRLPHVELRVIALMHRFTLQFVFLCVLIATVVAQSPDQSSEWTTAGYDLQRTAWNRAEGTLSSENVGQMRRLWKTVLPNTPHVLAGLMPPLVVSHRGRQLVIIGGSDNHVFALDAATGERVWQVDFATDAKPIAPDDWLCPNALTATPVIDRDHARLFAVASDGRLYALSLDDGRVLLSGVHFLPPFSKMASLSYIDGLLYSTTSQDCNLGRSGVWAIDPDSAGRVVRTLYTASSCSKGFCGAGIWGRAGVATDGEGNLYVATGDAPFNPTAGLWGMAMLQVDAKSLDVKDWFVPKNRDLVNKLDLDLGNTSPVVFKWRDRMLAAVGGKEGVIYLMDTARLGGPDHQTIAWTSPPYSNEKSSFQKSGIWGSIGSSIEPSSGRIWIYVPTYGPTTSTQSAEFLLKYGDDPNGSVQAFTVEADASGAPYLQPQWRSLDLKMPDPVAIANGVIYALATGEDATQATVDLITDVNWGPGGSILDERERARRHQGGRATLYALDARTGRQLWSSGDAITDWTHFSMPAVAGGRVFVTTNAGHVYAFGIGEDRGEHTYPPANSRSAPRVQPPPAKPAPASANARDGSPATLALFAKHCAQCHGPQGQGLASAHTPNMHDPAWQQTRMRANLEAAIRDGKTGGMPPFGTLLTPQQIRSLAAYIKAMR